LRKREDALNEAFGCFEKGHELDPTNPELLYWLADSYYYGEGVTQDLKKNGSPLSESRRHGSSGRTASRRGRSCTLRR
jgi:hypothetical protein